MAAIAWRLVPADEVGFVWPSVAPILAKAVERDDGRRSLHSVLVQLVTEQNQLWIVTAGGGDDREMIGVVVTAILLYPHRRVLKVEWLAGERFAEWADLISVLESYAKDQNCSAVEIAGRMGFARAFKDQGYSIVGFEGLKHVQ